MEQARVHSKGKHRSSRSGSSSRRVSSSSRLELEPVQSSPQQQQQQQHHVQDDETAIIRQPSSAVPVPAVRTTIRPSEDNGDTGSNSTATNASAKVNHNNNNNNNNDDDAIDKNQNPPDLADSTSLETVPGVTTEDKLLQKGILGYMDRQLKVQSLSDPQKSPAQRSTRSRSSLDKSPRRKRSKSESRRRRERKIIAAGEMEVRQANETLMRYLKQCSDFNDASLSGDLEIPENLEDRRVHRKTKSQRERKHQQQGGGSSKPAGDDPGGAYHGEIYNPFTPVVSPTTEAAPTRIDKMYIQTASGYRPVDNSYQHQYSHHRHHHHLHPHHHLHQLQLTRSGRGGNGDPESNNFTISTAVHLSCAVQRAWLHVSSICHGLLGGLALAHLLLICTTKPYDWVEASIRHYSAFAEVYANTFYCLAIICMVSIFDRMDISHFSLSGAAESNISFRSVVIIMIYAATIILSLSAGSMDERLYLSTANVTVWEEELETNKVLSIWNTLSIARSVGAIFGWVVIGMSPEQDQLYEHLLEMEKYQLQ